MNTEQPIITNSEKPSKDSGQPTLVGPVSALDRTFTLPDGATVADGREELDQQFLQRMGFRVGQLGQFPSPVRLGCFVRQHEFPVESTHRIHQRGLARVSARLFAVGSHGLLGVHHRLLTNC